MKGVSSIVGVVLLIAITVIAAIALYFMINNQQVNTNVQFGKLELADCQFDINTTNGVLLLKVRNTGNDPITSVKAILYSSDYKNLSTNETYLSNEIKTTGLYNLAFTVDNTSDLYTDISDNKILNNKYIVEFEGPVKLNRLEITSCKYNENLIP